MPVFDLVRRADGSVVDSAAVSIRAGEEWDEVLSDELVSGDLEIPPGRGALLIGPNVEVEGHVLVPDEAYLSMRPGSSLALIGGDPAAYVGGGMTYGVGPDAPYTNDIGIWAWGTGRLDIRGTPKTGWNRTGTDPTWKPDDEYWIAPTEVGDLSPRRWFPGDPIPQVDPRVPPAEVVNVTRDVLIEAESAGHIHIHSQVPQRVEYVRIERMGVFDEQGGHPVLGRYGLHHHHGGEGARGSLWRGIALVDSQGRGFVPHESHGITMEDCVALNSLVDPFWWDIGDDTDDLLVDRLGILGVHISRSRNGGSTPRYDAATLGAGSGPPEMRNSFVAGHNQRRTAAAFDWVSGGQVVTYEGQNPIWTFERGNVAHNNRYAGLRFWTNRHELHPVHDYTSYHNGDWGVENGAYRNRVSYFDCTLLDVFFQQSNSKADPPQKNERLVIDSPRECIRIGHRSLPPQDYQMWVDCELSAGEGHPKVYCTTGNNPWWAHFIRCGVTPDDFQFGDVTAPEMQGTSVLIDHEDGRKWEVRIEGGRKTVEER